MEGKIMTSNQELHAKALETAVLMFGKSLRPERQQVFGLYPIR
jgi:hypothetical protein